MQQEHKAVGLPTTVLPTLNLWIYLVKKWAALAALRGVRGAGWGGPDMISQQDPESTPPVERSPGGTRLKRIKVSELLGGAREVILEHDSQDYRLRITANGKLILTK